MTINVLISLLFFSFRKYILRIPAFRFILLFTLLSFLVTFVTYFLNYLVEYIFQINLDNTDAPLKESSVLKKFITACIVAPLFETVVFQWIIIECTYKKVGRILAIFISALIFGLSHFYSPIYIINTFFIGLIFSSGYILGKIKGFNPFLITVAIHSLHNFLILLIEVFLKSPI